MSTIRLFLDAALSSSVKQGRIIGSTETSFSVATRDGVKVVPRDTITPYAVNDEVRLVNGQLSGKLRSAASLPIYYV